MEKEDLIKSCLYYKGEEENPYTGDNAVFWNYERVWVRDSLTKEGREHLDKFVQMYSRVGLKFEHNDSTPNSLKALLFNRYLVGGLYPTDALEPFQLYYINRYKNGVKNL